MSKGLIGTLVLVLIVVVLINIYNIIKAKRRLKKTISASNSINKLHKKELTKESESTDAKCLDELGNIDYIDVDELRSLVQKEVNSKKTDSTKNNKYTLKF